LKKLVAYITSCYPEKSFSIDLALSLAQHGVDSLELGVPFSDPVADGPVIEEANHLSLQSGFKFQDLLDISREISQEIDTLWMGYFNPFYQYKIDKLTKVMQNLHVSGLIIPDLPFEEALVYETIFQKHSIANISFVAPTDSDERIKKITKNAQKFIYMVAYAGITGTSASEDLTPFISSIRTHTSTPVYVGFGVNETTAKEKSKNTDGVIVGSAFVKILLNENLSYTNKIEQCCNLADIIKNEINI